MFQSDDTTMITVIFLLMVSHVKLYAAAATVSNDDSVTYSHSKSPCRRNERFAFCKSCEQTCPGVAQVTCKPGCDSPGCYCDPVQGFVRDASGSCLPKAQCTGVVTQCRPNEVFARCRTCEGRCGENGHLCPLICRQSGCECPFRDGYVRDSSGNCIPSGHCPTSSTPTGTTAQTTTQTMPSSSTCAQVTCPSGQQCLLVDVLCVVSSCLRVPVCVPNFHV